MATKLPPTTEDPLAPFIRLSKNIYLREPTQQPQPQQQQQSSTDSTKNTISTIIISFWFSASPRALIRYVTQYTHLLPSARIIFILSGLEDFYLYPTTASHHRRLRPAVDALRASIEKDDGKRVLMHIFSNGGVFTTAHLLLAYRHVTGTALPVAAMIIDSAPGKLTPASTVRALSYALPKTPIIRQMALVAVYVSVLTGWSWRKLIRNRIWSAWKNGNENERKKKMGDVDSMAYTREALLDERLVIPSTTGDGDGKKGTAKRCYIYSDSDDLIPTGDVEEHAAQAVARGWPVDYEKFTGSPHVGHMRVDPERYWGIVQRYLI